MDAPRVTRCPQQRRHGTADHVECVMTVLIIVLSLTLFIDGIIVGMHLR